VYHIRSEITEGRSALFILPRNLISDGLFGTAGQLKPELICFVSASRAKKQMMLPLNKAPDPMPRRDEAILLVYWMKLALYYYASQFSPFAQRLPLSSSLISGAQDILAPRRKDAKFITMVLYLCACASLREIIRVLVGGFAALGLVCFIVGCHFAEPTRFSEPLTIRGQTKDFSGTKDPAGFLVAYTFNCASGPTIVTRIAGRDAINLVLQNEVRRLHRERAASGVRYSDRDVSLWSNGGEVTLRIREDSYVCLEERAESIREDARLRGVQFRATGKEAEWVLEVWKDRISFTDNIYGSAVVPGSVPEERDGTTLYVSTTEAHRLQVIIDQRECVDSMTGKHFEASVEVNLDGDGYRGCGYAP
jgi:uncharacterized membrane protein/membrane-bound inhibitor of C-type lysozyme